MDAEQRNKAIELAKEILNGEIWRKDVEAQRKYFEKIGESEWLAERVFKDREEALKNPDTLDYDAAINLAVTYLRQGGLPVMPEHLSQFVADVLEGKIKRKRSEGNKRGEDKYTNWRRDYSFMRAVEEVAKKYGSSRESVRGETAE